MSPPFLCNTYKRVSSFSLLLLLLPKFQKLLHFLCFASSVFAYSFPVGIKVIESEFGLEFPRPNDTIRNFPPGKIGVYTRFFKFTNFRLPLSTFFLRVLSHFGIHISQLSVLGAARVSHFEISCRAHGGNPTVHLFRRFSLAVSLPTGWVTFEKRRKKKNTIVPTCYTDPFDSLKGWREKFFWVNASVALIAMRWFSGKEFPRDSAVDSVNGRKHWVEPYVVPNHFDVVCAEKKLAENERPLLKQTVDVVTQSSDNIINLDVVPLDQVPLVVALPPLTNVRKRSPVQAPALQLASKKGKM
ncbi:hypothetical protein Tco_1138417 [Tanacetum coccineum]